MYGYVHNRSDKFVGGDKVKRGCVALGGGLSWHTALYGVVVVRIVVGLPMQYVCWTSGTNREEFFG